MGYTEYITHHRFKAKALCGYINLPHGTILLEIGNLLCTTDGKPICCKTSENAKMHFSRNDDKMGLKRGTITYSIAYGKRNESLGRRFTDQEVFLLTSKYAHFLKNDTDTILFNDSFFAADIHELEAMVDDLMIVKEEGLNVLNNK